MNHIQNEQCRCGFNEMEKDNTVHGTLPPAPGKPHHQTSNHLSIFEHTNHVRHEKDFGFQYASRLPYVFWTKPGG